jgi:hypothetical protein
MPVTIHAYRDIMTPKGPRLCELNIAPLFVFSAGRASCNCLSNSILLLTFEDKQLLRIGVSVARSTNHEREQFKADRMRRSSLASKHASDGPSEDPVRRVAPKKLTEQHERGQPRGGQARVDITGIVPDDVRVDPNMLNSERHAGSFIFLECVVN